MTTDLFGEPLIEAMTPPKKSEVMSEISPGQYVSKVNVWELPQYVISKYVPNGDGSYRVEPCEEWLGWYPITEIAKHLGIKISDPTLKRLCVAGMIEHCQPTPQIYLVKIDSLINHLSRTKNTLSEEASWWTPQRRQLWTTTCGG